MQLERLLSVARACVRPAPSARMKAAQAELGSRLAAGWTGGGAAPIAFVFHNDVPPDLLVAQYPDLALDQRGFDFPDLIDRFVARARRRGMRVLLVTGEEGGADARDGLEVVRLPLDPAAPMHERVRAMHAFVHSPFFDAPTAFLDSDAFVNCDPRMLFARPFDVAVTWRDDPLLMPVNEGAILARPDRPHAVRAFFDAYLGTYEALAEDRELASEYGDVRRWRGGQLSLTVVATDGRPSSMERRTVNGASVAYLPCDTFNYVVRRPEQLTPENANGRHILHLKGNSKKEAVLLRMLDALEGGRPAAASTSARAAAGAPYVAPHFAQFNKSWAAPPFHDPPARQAAAKRLGELGQLFGANRPEGRAALVDDMLVWFRNLGFLSDPGFAGAFEPYRDDPLLRARIWRVYVLCWAARSCQRLDGDFVDFGCYDGRTMDVVARYTRFADERRGRRWVMYDIFDEPPAESRKSGHGNDLFDRVRAMFVDVPGVEIVKGVLPDASEGNLPERIAFAQVDLNDAEAEVRTIEAMLPRMVPGGLVVLDDFGFARYRESHERETALFARHGLPVLELPTGQGLVVAR